jgi:hypothetical protein
LLPTRKLILGSGELGGSWFDGPCACGPYGPAASYTRGMVCPGGLAPGRNPHLPPHACAHCELAQGPVPACPHWAGTHA